MQRSGAVGCKPLEEQALSSGTMAALCTIYAYRILSECQDGEKA